MGAEIVAVGSELLLGTTAGSTGETGALLILLGGTWLVVRNMMNWRIPLSIFLMVFAFSGLLYMTDTSAYPSPLFSLLAGGLVLGAVFMATDMVSAPITGAGCLIYGAIIGGVIVVIRVWGGMPEGVAYAILLGNALAPHIDRLVRPTVYGTGGRREVAP